MPMLGGLDPAVFFGIAAVVLVVWGAVVAIFNEWAAGLGRGVWRVWGRDGAAMTPAFARLIGIVLLLGGIGILVLVATGTIPHHGR